MVETNYKYVSPIIAKTNKDKIIRLRQENPDYTLLQIGKQVGVSRERVRQVLQKNGLQTRSTAAAKHLIPKHLRKGDPCPRCGTPVPWVENLGVTKHSNGKYYQRGGFQKYCSVECRRAPMTKYVCTNCGKEKEITVSQYRAKLRRREEGLYSEAIYCSHSCKSLGYWKVAKGLIENTYGYKNNPYVLEGGNHVKRSKKIDLQCHTCGTKFSLTEGAYTSRMSGNTGGHVYCGRVCYQVRHSKETRVVVVECGNCKKEMSFPLGQYNNRIRTSKSGKLYCNQDCFWEANSDIRKRNIPYKRV
mgnify:CR=1 FL=1